ncbi:MAG: hypothetical protein ACM3UW_02665 [Bacillota bacterium]
MLYRVNRWILYITGSLLAAVFCTGLGIILVDLWARYEWLTVLLFIGGAVAIILASCIAGVFTYGVVMSFELISSKWEALRENPLKLWGSKD